MANWRFIVLASISAVGCMHSSKGRNSRQEHGVLADISKISENAEFQQFSQLEPTFYLTCFSADGTSRSWSAPYEAGQSKISFKKLSNVKEGDNCTLDMSAKSPKGLPLDQALPTAEKKEGHAVIFISNAQPLSTQDGSLALKVSLYRSYNDLGAGPQSMTMSLKGKGSKSFKALSVLTPKLACKELKDAAFSGFSRPSTATSEFDLKFNGLAAAKLTECKLEIAEMAGTDTIPWVSAPFSVEIKDGENKQTVEIDKPESAPVVQTEPAPKPVVETNPNTPAVIDHVTVETAATAKFPATMIGIWSNTTNGDDWSYLTTSLKQGGKTLTLLEVGTVSSSSKTFSYYGMYETGKFPVYCVFQIEESGLSKKMSCVTKGSGMVRNDALDKAFNNLLTNKDVYTYSYTKTSL